MASNGTRTATFQELIDEGTLEIGDGYRAKNNELGGSGPIFLRAGHVTDSHIDFAGVERFHEHLRDRLTQKFAKPGDTIVTTKGNSTGRTSFVTERMPEFVYSPHLSYWRSKNPDNICGGFLRYWSRGSDFIGQLRGMSASTDMAPYLSLTDQRRVKITLPPIGVQKRIAEILGTLDDKIELNRRMNATLEAMARRLFKSWFVDFDPVHAKAALRRRHPKLSNADLSRRALRNLAPKIAELFPDSFEDSTLGPIPQGWKVGTVAGICSQAGNGGTPRRDTPAYWEPASVPWLTSGEVRQSIITSTDSAISEAGLQHSAAKVWPASTTIVALYGATAGQSAYSAIELSANQACCGLQPKSGFRAFLYLYVSSSTERLEQQARGSAQQNLSKQIVEDLAITIPDDMIADRFDLIMEPLFGKWIALLKESRQLEVTRDKLLPRLLSGELPVDREVV